MSGSDKPRTVKLLCPSLSQTVAFAAWDDQKLDLGSIARAFGLEPSTLKLNGHFISRGIDLVSSSVTWRSLLNFFSAKGLSTGRDDKDALLVDGKLSKSGTKRGHDPQDDATVIRDCDRTEQEKANELNKKLKKNNYSGFGDGDHGFKRKQLLEDVSLFKKLKINETDSVKELGDKGKNYLGTISSSKLKCSYISNDMKRRREDEVILTAPCKRIRIIR
ncbi:hypothetical protein JCGZ_17528 [Jatropha curcas]|uniref:Uncharacterized protein n=1 Tax=Jatropha curcas TaxID=180498 RepID=A0A067K280_JATCU|nr:uncharacterized protein LOC105644934 [Jatropha curcas]KDP26370.1 hypothetical protein JCGZ_17528 [Jatropha curcas]